jgi:PPM family protein phosphatase
MSMPLYVHGRSDVGRRREQNEDRFRIESFPDGARLLVVCDGMGGHEAGEVASEVACQRLVEFISSSPQTDPPRAIYQAFMEANRAVLEAASSRGVEGMGTTGVLAWVTGTRCYVGWVGDSRLYHLRPGEPVDRSRDHTRVERMLSQGLLTPEEARNHPEAHVLVQALGGTPHVQKSFKPEVWNEPLELRRGDVVLLCSDGLYDLIEDSELHPLIESLDYRTAVERLIDTANERGGTDNITVIVLVAGQPEVPTATTAPIPRVVRRKTIPEGMPQATPAEARPTEPSVPAVATPTLQVESAPVAAAEQRGLLKRQVPLWWVAVAAALALGLGLGLGRGARQGEAPVQQLPRTSSTGSAAESSSGSTTPAAAAAVAPAPTPAVNPMESDAGNEAPDAGK